MAKLEADIDVSLDATSRISIEVNDFHALLVMRQSSSQGRKQAPYPGFMPTWPALHLRSGRATARS